MEWTLHNVNNDRERTVSASSASGIANSLELYEKKLIEILASSSTNNEIIFDKIETEFSDVDFECKLFVRALVISVCKSCLSDKFDTNMFKKRGCLLNKFINKKEEFELESLDHA